MTLHCATELTAIAELLDAIEKFQCDLSHDLTLSGSLNVSDGDDTKKGELQISDGVWHYVIQETKENE